MHDALRKFAQLSAVALLFGCKTEGPVEYGWLRVQTVTSGTDIDDYYDVEVNTPTGPQSQSFGPNDSAVLSTSAGEVHITVGDIDTNCTPSGANPRSVHVPANDTATTTFAVTCVAIGAYVSINIGFAGVDRDVDGYRVALDNVAYSVRVIDSIEFRKVPPGTHTVALRDVAANCTVATDTLRTATFAVADTLRLRWGVTCVEVANRPLLFSGYVPISATLFDIYVRNPHDTVPVNLTRSAGVDELPVWSPNGQRIAFVSNRTGHDEVFVMNADGSGVVQLTNVSGGNSYPVWSPDGSRIAFISGRAGHKALFVMNADGSAQVRFTTDTAPEHFPSWAGDGVRIAYLRGCVECFPSTAEVYVANGTETTRLTTQARAYNWPVWSPDDAHIAFTSGDSVAVMDADGSHPVRLFGWSPTWSPDGKQLAYVRYDGIHRGRLDGSGDTLLAVGGGPAWSADGNAIAFVQLDGCNAYGCLYAELMVMDSDGTRRVRLTDRAMVFGVRWGP